MRGKAAVREYWRPFPLPLKKRADWFVSLAGWLTVRNSRSGLPRTIRGSNLFCRPTARHPRRIRGPSTRQGNRVNAPPILNINGVLPTVRQLEVTVNSEKRGGGRQDMCRLLESPPAGT